MSARTPGRPRAASRELLEEAACELFLEQGYGATSVADITERAGVSRSTFFNYVDSKSDLLWARFDDAVARLRLDLARLRGRRGPGAMELSADPIAAEREVIAGMRELAAALPPENVALAFSQGDAMRLGEDLRVAAARRLVDVADVAALHLRSRERSPMVAEVRAQALAGALLAAVRAWSLAGAGSHELPALLEESLAALVPPHQPAHHACCPAPDGYRDITSLA